MKNKQKAQKQNIKASVKLIKYLQQVKLDNNHKSLEETIWSFIGYELHSKEEESNNNSLVSPSSFLNQKEAKQNGI